MEEDRGKAGARVEEFLRRAVQDEGKNAEGERTFFMHFMQRL